MRLKEDPEEVRGGWWPESNNMPSAPSEEKASGIAARNYQECW
jgi:hypothetical protein